MSLNKAECMLYMFGLGVQLAMLIATPITYLTILTFIGTNLSLLCILCITNVAQINGIVGIISAICFITIDLHSRLYMNGMEQLIYVILLDIPCLVMGENWVRKAASKIQSLDFHKWLIAIGGTIIWFGIFFTIMNDFTNDSNPLWDSIAFSIACLGSVLTTLKYREAYFAWLFGGVSQVVLFFIAYKQGQVSNPAMCLNYICFVVNDFLAFFHSSWWNKKYQHKQIITNKKRYGVD